MLRTLATLLLAFCFASHRSVAESVTSAGLSKGLRYAVTTSDCSYGTEHFIEIVMIEESVFKGGGYAGGRDLGASGLECEWRFPTRTVSDPLATIKTIEDGEPTLLLAVVSGTLPEKVSEIHDSRFASTLTDHMSPIYMDASGRWEFGPWQADYFSGAIYPNPAVLLRCRGPQVEEVIPSNYLIEIRQISCDDLRTQGRALGSAVFVIGLGAYSYFTYPDVPKGPDKIVVHAMVDVPLEYEMFRAVLRYIGKPSPP